MFTRESVTYLVPGHAEVLFRKGTVHFGTYTLNQSWCAMTLQG